MSNQRTHYVTTTDGVTIGGTVHGQGRPLVFVHGMMADGDTDWQALLPHSTGRFTCYLPSYRGRGLSGDHPDLSPGRMVDDILAYVDSIEAPTGLVGWSSGATWPHRGRGAVRRGGRGGPLEPGVLSLMDEQEQAAFGDAAAPHGRAGRRRQVDGCGSRVRGLALQRRRDRHGRGRGLLRGRRTLRPEPAQPLQQWGEYEPTPDDPAVLGAISAPVLVLHGADTTPFLTASARYVADGVPNARARDPRRRAHRPPDPSRGARRCARRVLRTSPKPA